MSTGLQSVALDILQTLVRANAGNKENNPRPLSQLLVANAFPAAVKCTLHSDDNSVTQVPHFQSSCLVYSEVSKIKVSSDMSTAVVS